MKIGTNDISKLYLGGVEIEKIYLGTSQVYEGEEPTPPTPVPYSGQYLTIESTSNNNTIYLKAWASSNVKTISASTDNGETWTAYTSTTGNGTTIATLNTGDKVLVKGTETEYPGAVMFGSTGSYEVKGNIMSLLYGDNFIGQTTLSGTYTLSGIFYDSTNLTSAENLILPATTLTDGCYSSLFGGCTSLTTAPELPATTLTNNCYMSMFDGCTNLATAPELPATTLAVWCYYGMFNGCTSLNYIKCLATDISASDCTADWVNDVAATGTFVKAAPMSSWTNGTSGIPDGWTIQNDDGSPYINDNWDDQE